jgi:hypothetical protein
MYGTRVYQSLGQLAKAVDVVTKLIEKKVELAILKLPFWEVHLMSKKLLGNNPIKWGNVWVELDLNVG